MIKVAIAGITGRMGQTIYRSMGQPPYSETLTLSQASVLETDPALGKTVKEVLGGNAQIKMTTQLTEDFDVLIDFTSISSTLNHVEFCQKHQKSIVIGTTGFSGEDKQQIALAAKHTAVFLSANMSLGVNVTNKLATLAAAVLHQQSDIEIIEAHHKHKVDAPSGTALMLGQSIADTLNIDLESHAVKERNGITGEREAGTIGFSTIRGGDVVGEHSVVFYMDGERVEISHKATDRKIFANGALFAACFLVKQSAGLYDMNDALNLEHSEA